MKKLLFTVILFCSATALLRAQQPVDKAQLENERKNIQDELKAIQKAYDEVKNQKSQSLSQLNILKRKMNLQERYISSINKELRMIDDDIYTSNLEIYRLSKQLDTLKANYARTIVYAYKNRSSFDYVNFIFSASSFNDGLRRIAYLKSYQDYREKQVASIYKTQDQIAKKQQQQLVRKGQKNKALESQTQQRSELESQRKEKDAVVSKLKSQEKDLKKQMEAKRKRDNELKNSIAAIIRREIDAGKKAEAAEAERKKATAVTPAVTPGAPATAPVTKKPESYLERNATDIALGADFSKNKGKLPWPVDNAFVKIPYGVYTIEGTPLKGNNPGLTIGTPKGSVVKSVFEGEVSSINNTGEGYMVVLRHGKYYTIYSNLASVNVSKGAKVKTGQQLGSAGIADDGSGGQIDFVLMIELNNVNPASWLR